MDILKLGNISYNAESLRVDILEHLENTNLGTIYTDENTIEEYGCIISLVEAIKQFVIMEYDFKEVTYDDIKISEDATLEEIQKYIDSEEFNIYYEVVSEKLKLYFIK